MPPRRHHHRPRPARLTDGREALSYPDSLARDDRRALGAYYTPPGIVNHLVGKVAELLSFSRQSSPRILDPATGDGVFLSAMSEPSAARLTGIDIDPHAVELANQALAGRAGILHADFLEQPPPVDGPFDAILGNPPWGNWSRKLSFEELYKLRDRFSTARGLIDPFALFIERATSLLGRGGILAFVLPDYFLLKNYVAARRHVLDNYRVIELIHWGRIFPGVNLDVCTMVAVKEHAGPDHGIVCRPEGPKGRTLRIPQSRFMAAEGHRFNLTLDGEAAALMNRLEGECVPLSEWLEMHEGIHSGNIRERLFLPPGPDTPLTRPLIFGRDEIRPFRLKWAGKRVLYDRSVIRRERGEYASLGREHWFTSPKILVRRTGDRLMAALDSDGYFASNNLFVVLPLPRCPVPLAYLEAFLNSSLATWWFRTAMPRKGRLFAELKLIHLSRLPVPPPRGEGDIARLVESAGDPVLLDDVVGDLARLTPAEKIMVARERRSTTATSSL